MDDTSSTCQAGHTEPCYVSLNFDLDDSGTDDEKNDDSNLGPLLHSVIEDIAGEQIEICTELSDDNVEIIHLTSNNLQETLPGLEIFTTVPSAENPTQTISLSAGLFCPVTVQWLLENFETREGVSLPRSTVYNHYISHCKLHDMEPVNAASFGKLIRSIFLGLQTRRLGTRGNSKYHYYGIQIKHDSSLNEIQDIIRIEAPDTTSGHRNCNSSVATPEVNKVKKKPAETVTSGAYKVLRVMTPEKEAETATIEVNITQEVVAELNGEPLNNATIMEVVVDDSSAQVVEMMSLMNVDQDHQQQQQVVVAIKEGEPPEANEVDDPIDSVYVKTCMKLIPKIQFKLKSFKEWREDLQKVAKLTGHAEKGKILAKKIDKIAALIMESCPKIDYKLTSDILSRSEVDLFRRNYQALAEKLVRKALTYRLDEFMKLIFRFWNREPDSATEKVFSKNQLMAISKNDCIRHYVISVDSQVYEILLISYFPDNVNAIPPFILQILYDFSIKLELFMSKAMQDYPLEMQTLKISAAKAFAYAVKSRAKLNVLVDLARPVFQESNRKKINHALADLNAILTSRGKAPSQSELYQLELFRFAFDSISHVEQAGLWLENEIENAVRPPKSNKEEKPLEQLAKEFVLELDCLMHVVCHMAYTDEAVNGLLTLFACFASAYSAYAIEKQRVVNRNTNLISHLMETLP